MGWLLVAVQLLAGWLSNRNYLALPVLPESVPAEEDLGDVAIVIPARDEARRLPALLASLARIQYRPLQVVVVDDASTDGTATIAARCGARVIRVDGPAAGWTGKCWACQAGADATDSRWLLFTDADTIHGPHCLARTLQLAVQRESGFVSLLARQRCETFWERLLLPYAYALYFVSAIRPNRPGGSPLANGQYMLFRRETYQLVGGHAAVRNSVVEDVALARVAQERGIRVVTARGDDLQVRMYSDLASLWEGFTKNVVRFIALNPRTGILTVLTSIAWSSSLPAALRSRSRWLRLALLASPTLSLRSWERRFDVSVAFALLYPLTVLVFQVLALDSALRTARRGRTTWKGRRY